jgi:pilus assembly protein CpaB
MNPRTVVLLVVALATAGGTAFMVKGYLSSQQRATEPVARAEDQPAKPTVEILVAKEDLTTGTFLKAENLTWQAWPEEGVIEGYVVKAKGKETDFVGAVARTHLHAGEPITPTRVVHPGDRGFLAAVVDPGKRAISVPVDATRGVSGFIYPGDRVDVLLSLKATIPGEDEEQPSTRYFSETVLADVRVLGIDQTTENTGAAPRVPKTATIEVTPQQAEKVSVALEIGELSLSLRSVGRQEAGIETLTRKLTEKHAAAASQARQTLERQAAGGQYTTELDVLSMIGDPMGLPMPNGFGPKVTLIRGSETSTVRF